MREVKTHALRLRWNETCWSSEGDLRQGSPGRRDDDPDQRRAFCCNFFCSVGYLNNKSSGLFQIWEFWPGVDLNWFGECLWWLILVLVLLFCSGDGVVVGGEAVGLAPSTTTGNKSCWECLGFLYFDCFVRIYEH